MVDVEKIRHLDSDCDLIFIMSMIRSKQWSYGHLHDIRKYWEFWYMHASECWLTAATYMIASTRTNMKEIQYLPPHTPIELHESGLHARYVRLIWFYSSDNLVLPMQDQYW